MDGSKTIYRVIFTSIDIMSMTFLQFLTRMMRPLFLEYMIFKQPNIKFTMEVEVSNCLVFLDVLVTNSVKKSISVFRKLTFTGLLTNFFSYTGETYRIGLIKNQLYKLYNLNTRTREDYSLIYFESFHDLSSTIFKS